MGKRVCVVITTRGNYAKMKRVVELIKSNNDLDLQVVMLGGVVSERAIHTEIIPDKKCYFLVDGSTPYTMAKTAGLATMDFANAFNDLKPDCVVAIADRFEVLPLAMAASYMNIPVVHVEGGEVSGSIDESIRHAVTKISNLHFPCTEKARENIIRMGEDPEAVFNVGSTSLDVISRTNLSCLAPLFSFQDKTGVGEKINFNEDYIIVIYHPVTTEYGGRDGTEDLERAVIKSGFQTVWVWPNFDAGSETIAKKIREFREKTENMYFVRFFTGVPIEVYGPMLANARCIVGNSSSGIREASFLGTPCVNIGSRQNGRERAGNVMDVPCDMNTILESIKTQTTGVKFKPSTLYGDGHASERIVDTLGQFDLKVQKRLAY